MPFNPNSFIELDTLLTVAAVFLGLSLVVEVMQEIYKYLTHSKALTYRKVLQDFFGSWILRLYQEGPAARFHVRGPFQMIKSRPTGVLLPLKKDELLEAMDSIGVSGWFAYLLQTLKDELRLQQGRPALPSIRLRNALRTLREAADSSGPAALEAAEMLRFLFRWGSDDDDALEHRELDAQHLLHAFYQEFFPDRIRAEEEFSQLETNFQYAYFRRNLRQSFLFGLVIAVLMNVPFNIIWERAARTTPEEAAALAEAALLLQADRESPLALTERANRLVQYHLSAPTQESTRFLGHLGNKRPAQWVSFVAFCLVTALLICFGAPFWHRLTEALLPARKKVGLSTETQNG